MREHASLQPELKVSKWLKIPVLVDRDELGSLFSLLSQKFSDLKCYTLHSITRHNEGAFQADIFLHRYETYLENLHVGRAIASTSLSCALSATEEAFYSLRIDETSRLIKPQEPAVQIQANWVRYSPEDKVFRCGVYGEDAFTWGVQFSYPQIFQDSTTYEIRSVHTFANTPLFKEIQSWIRNATRPTPFIACGRKTNEPIRLGKNCFKWINSHFQLQALDIKVDNANL